MQELQQAAQGKLPSAEAGRIALVIKGGARYRHMAVKRKTQGARTPTSRSAANKARAGRSSITYSPHEYIKVVPPHPLKPTLSIEELIRAKTEQSDSDQFAGQAPTAA